MQITKFRAFLEGYVNFLEEMAAGEQEKYSAVLSYDPKQMDKVVSRQQAMNMRLNQLEEQREKEQEEAGIAALTFQEILDRLEEKGMVTRSVSGADAPKPRKSNAVTR